MPPTQTAECHFEKFQGCGNDFIILEESSLPKKLRPAEIKYLCDRKMGIGADGLILLEASSVADFSMRYFNADGNESTLCGNGGRCIAWYACLHGIAGKELHFNALNRTHKARILEFSGDTSLVTLNMPDVTGIQVYNNYTILDTGSPHYVSFPGQLSGLDVKELGAEIRFSPPFAEKGINVNFVSLTAQSLFVRTYERGVEDETLSCGTGVTASALSAAFLHSHLQSPLTVQTLGGQLSVYFRRTANGFTDVWLEGPAVRVFRGNVILPV
ncbi:MAG TPA: diaminopimelate epimerase [Bacteroidales bacterium]|nr:diaminopimelate epimerase [Bacteroidales bacterium]HSA43341.1 diaminopimelate epimerase [Bacteroidales bacterium]